MTSSTNFQHHRRPAIFWLIVKREVGQEKVLTMNLDEGKTLPIFSFEDEARIFLSFGTFGVEWQIKKTTAGELKGMLLGPWAGVGFVSLDPLPELVYKRVIGLVSLRKEQFVDGFSDSIIKNGEKMELLVLDPG